MLREHLYKDVHIWTMIPEAEQDPARLDYLTHLMNVSRYLERIADHATNIAEDVIYLAQGEIVRHHAREYRERPPGPASSRPV